MSRVKRQIAVIYRVKSYIVIATFSSLLAALYAAHPGAKLSAELDGDLYSHTILVIMDFYVPILVAMGVAIYEGREADAPGQRPPEGSVATLFSFLLFTFVLGAPPLAYYNCDVKVVNNWLVGSAAALSSVLAYGLRYYFGAEQVIPAKPAPDNQPLTQVSDN